MNSVLVGEERGGDVVGEKPPCVSQLHSAIAERIVRRINFLQLPLETHERFRSKLFFQFVKVKPFVEPEAQKNKFVVLLLWGQCLFFNRGFSAIYTIYI